MKYISGVFILFLVQILHGQAGFENSNLRVVENKGQWETPVSYKTELNGGAVFFQQDRIRLNFYHPDDWNYLTAHPEDRSGISEPEFIRSHAYDMVFVGGKAQVPNGMDRQQGYYNYFIGDNPDHWADHVHAFSRLKYTDIWPSIDAYWGAQEGHLKYNFVMKPGAKASAIVTEYQGVEDVYLRDGKLIIPTSVNEVTELEPYAYIAADADWQAPGKAIRCDFKIIGGNRISFSFPDGYPADKTIVIDPVLTFSTYTGSTTDNWGYTATYDDSGHLYAGGVAFGGGYPTTTGAFQTAFNGGNASFPCDVSVTKFSKDGTALIWSSYLGGSANEAPHSMIVNSSDELYIYGTTSSLDFPVQSGAYDNSFNGGTSVNPTNITYTNGSDIYVARIAADGSALLNATFVGGSGNDGLNMSNGLNFNYADHARGEIILGQNEDVIVASSTNSSNFPITSAAFQQTKGAGQDGCIFKLSRDLSSMMWSTFLGGASDDACYSVKTNAANEVIITGGTQSNNFPVTPGALFSAYQGGLSDGYVAKLNATGSTMLRSTYLGTPSYDQGYITELDGNDRVYVVGQTEGFFPITAGVYNNPNSGQFLVRMDALFTSFDFSTVFGKGDFDPDISPTALLVDGCNNIYISGWGGGTNQFSAGQISDFNITGMPVTQDAYKNVTDGSDFYFIVFGPNAQNLEYATYFGGQISQEHVDGGTSRFDDEGIIYQAVCAGCGGNDDFPSTPNAWSPTNNSVNCNLGALKFEFQLYKPVAEASGSPDLSGCVPLLVQFSNAGSFGDSSIWYFGDGDSSVAANPAHLYTAPGDYFVKYIIIDTNTCALADTAFLTVRVADSVHADAVGPTSISGCQPLTANFNNSGSTGDAFIWYFGDGDSSGQGIVTHVYEDTGTFVATGIALDTSVCSSQDTISIIVQVLLAARAEAKAEPYSKCQPPYIVTFNSDSSQAITYVWSFGDGKMSNDQHPTHTYSETGTYTVQLIVEEPGLCKEKDTTTLIVEFAPLPSADFTFAPDPGIIDLPVQFTNQSLFSTVFSWAFGDGNSSSEENPGHTYLEKGNYTICLAVANNTVCGDTVCKTIEIIDKPVIDVPTAFSPNGDGTNDVLFVRGRGVAQLSYKIFNRWGELIFETTSLDVGWDGTYKGVPQEMDAYIYVLDATLANGEVVLDKGNVTLIR